MDSIEDDAKVREAIVDIKMERNGDEKEGDMHYPYYIRRRPNATNWQKSFNKRSAIQSYSAEHTAYILNVDDMICLLKRVRRVYKAA